MSHKDAVHIVTPENIHVDKDGTLFYYFSDALDGKDQEVLRNWGMDLPDHSVTENNLSIVVDLPAMVHDLLAIGYGSANETGTGYVVDVEHRAMIDAVKRQLEDALAKLNAIEYEGSVPEVADPEKCSDDVFKHGVSLGFFDMTKQEAEAYCVEQTQKTGRLHDWHYVGGRVHIKAIPGEGAV